MEGAREKSVRTSLALAYSGGRSSIRWSGGGGGRRRRRRREGRQGGQQRLEGADASHSDRAGLKRSPSLG